MSNLRRSSLSSSNSNVRTSSNSPLLSETSSPRSDDNSPSESFQKEQSEIEATFFSYISSENISACISFFENPSYQAWKFRDEDNYSALHHSTYINDYNFTLSIISTTKRNASFKVLQTLINSKSNKGFTALHYASYRGNIKIIKLLLENGADIYCKNKAGLNVMHMAAQGNKINSMYFFLKQYGLDINSNDHNGCTPLHWACYFNSEKVVKFILLTTNNLDVNSLNNDKFTPLHLAVLSGGYRNVKHLLLKGADPKIKNNKGKIPLDLAKTGANNQIIKLLSGNKIDPLIKNSYTIFIFYFLHLLIPLLLIEINIPFIQSHNIIYWYSLWALVLYAILVINQFIDSGEIKINANTLSLLDIIENVDIEKYCPVCESKNTLTSVHCYICQKCIDGFDHHCLWMGKCVGRGNKSLFYFTMFLIFLNLIVINIISLFSEFSGEIGEFKGLYYLLGEKMFFLKHIFSVIVLVVGIFGIMIVTPLVHFWVKTNFKDTPKAVMQKIEKVDDVNLNKIEFSEFLIHGKKAKKNVFSLANPNKKTTNKQNKNNNKSNCYLTINEEV